MINENTDGLTISEVCTTKGSTSMQIYIFDTHCYDFHQQIYKHVRIVLSTCLGWEHAYKVIIHPQHWRIEDPYLCITIYNHQQRDLQTGVLQDQNTA